MKKLLLLTLLLASSIGCKPTGNVIFVTLEAQSFPITKQLLWDQPDLLSASINNFTVSTNGATPVNIDPATCQQVSPFSCSMPVTFTAAGTFTFVITPYNVVFTGPTTTYVVNVKIPGNSQNVRIK